MKRSAILLLFVFAFLAAFSNDETGDDKRLEAFLTKVDKFYKSKEQVSTNWNMPNTNPESSDYNMPTGNMGSSEVAGAATPWRRVGLVQVGLVARSANPAAVAQRETGGTTNATKLSALGVEFAPPSDTRYRTVYESTIALRNRLFGH